MFVGHRKFPPRFDPAIKKRNIGFDRDNYLVPPPMPTFWYVLSMAACFLFVPVVVAVQSVYCESFPGIAVKIKNFALSLACTPVVAVALTTHRRFREARMTLLLLGLFIGFVLFCFGYLTPEYLLKKLSEMLDAASKSIDPTPSRR